MTGQISDRSKQISQLREMIINRELKPHSRLGKKEMEQWMRNSLTLDCEV